MSSPPPDAVRDKKGGLATHRAYLAGIQWEPLHRGSLQRPGPRVRPFKHLFEEHIMKTTTKFAAVSLATLSIAVASAVFAHPGMGFGPGMGPGMGYGMGPGMGMGYGMGPGYGMGMGPGMRGGMAGPETPAVVGARLSDLKTELKITAAQDGAWQAYAMVVQKQAEQRQALRTQMQAQMQDPKAAAPVDRAAQHEAMTKVRDEHLAARSAALKDLYAVLTPEQKALADQQLQAMPGHRMAGRGWAR
jgi:Spy/CpxP family protein refolding chaperone